MTATHKTGQASEDKALAFLQTHNLQLLERNFRCKLGEIDLIMQDQDEIVFVEVRTRSNDLFGTAAESVDHRKQQKIIRSATLYLSQKKWLNKVNCRFDIIGISYAQMKASIEWIKDAFPGNNYY